MRRNEDGAPLEPGNGDPIIVVSARQLGPKYRRTLESIDPRLRFHSPGVLPTGTMDVSKAPDDEYYEIWRRAIVEAEVLFGLPDQSPRRLLDAVRSAGRLRWIQLTASDRGEAVKVAKLVGEAEQVAITDARSVRATPLAEFAMARLLSFAKDLPSLQSGQRSAVLDGYHMAELSGRTMLVVGLGPVGTEVARLAKAFGMRVLAVNRLGHTDSPYVDEIRTPRFLGDLLPVSHAVVLALPLTKQTSGMIGAREIDRMRFDSFLINVGSPGVLDEPVLLDALGRGAVAGAALDGFATAGMSAHEDERIKTLFADNMQHYLAGHDLIGRVDPAA